MNFLKRNLGLTTLVILLFIKSSSCDNYFSRSSIKQGLLLSDEVDAFISESVYLHLTETVADQTQCFFRQPGKDDIDIFGYTSEKITRWDEHACGIRINNIATGDSGYWRLTSFNSNNNNTARGVSFVNVLENHAEIPHQIYAPMENITIKGAKYCYVLRPGQEKYNFPQHNDCVIPEIEQDFEAVGTWRIVVGMEGKTEEVEYDVNVDAKVERIVTNVEKLENKINLNCTILNTNKVIKFCRFLRISDDVGFNLEEGLGNPKYKYFGNGFHRGECGLTIIEPDENDLSSWKCFIGYIENHENKTMGSVIHMNEDAATDLIEAPDAFGINEEPINVLCKSKLEIEYCWFSNPTGDRLAVTDVTALTENDNYRYFGNGLKLGECGITILKSHLNDTGIWKCHMGTVARASVERVRDVYVRVAESHLVASKQHITDIAPGSALSIECTTIPEHYPVEYCRFVLPDGTAFSINEGITSENQLLDNYYFNPNREMKLGYCSIIVRRVTSAHNGRWSCAARLVGAAHESLDDFDISSITNGLSVASIVGMTVGASFVLIGVLVITIIAFRRRKINQPPTDSMELE